MLRERRGVALGLILLGSLTCEAPFVPDTGALTITVQTVGVDLDPDGYVVVVGDSSYAIASQGSLTFPDLAAGTFTIGLAGVAGNCVVGLPHPREVRVPPVNATAFVVNCVPLTGSVRFTVTTNGADPDPDGYTITIGTAIPTPLVLRSGVTVIPGVRTGSYPVTIGGVAENCTARLPNPGTLTVTFDSTSDVAITVDCVAFTGVLRVGMTTMGNDIDPNGYQVTLTPDSGGLTLTRLLGVNGTMHVRIAAGVYAFRLLDMAPNCVPVPAVPDSVTVIVADTVRLDYAVSCRVLPTIEVTTITTGPDPDVNGYDVLVDSLRVGHVGRNETMWIKAHPGSHEVTLGDVAENCLVTPDPAVATLSYGDIAQLVLEVRCPPIGYLLVTVATSGPGRDPSGYVVSMTNLGSVAFGEYGAWFVPVPAQDYVVSLGDVAPNCTVNSANPDTVTVVGDDTARVAFDVYCLKDSGRLTITTASSGMLDRDGYSVLVTNNYPYLYAFTGRIGVNETLVVPDVPYGTTTVALQNVESHCVVSAPNPATVLVPQGGDALAAFAVTCAPPGDLEVIVATTGENPDTNGYIVFLSELGLPIQQYPVASNDTILLTGLYPTERSLQLTGVAPNCIVSGGGIRSVPFTGGGTTRVRYDVLCAVGRPPVP